MQITISPAATVSGFVRPPGDKSISHRYAIIAAIAEGASRIHNYSTGADCQSTLSCLRDLGAVVENREGVLAISGHGRYGLRQPSGMLDAGNSGSTIRMLSGILAAQPFSTSIGGDESLSRRPMDRIMKPLGDMGATIHARAGRFPPLQIEGGPLRAIDYTLPVASAQVKSCILLAGLYAGGATTVREPVRTRDHTELALREFGAEVESARGVIRVQANPRLEARELLVPGDLSSAAFFMVAALLVPDSELAILSVGLNPTRAALVEFLVSAGARIRVTNVQERGGELIGDLQIKGGRVLGGLIEKELTAALIDEIPVLAVLGAASELGLTVRDAGELRVKETDRIATLAENFRRMGVSMEVMAEGFHVPGKQRFAGAQVDSFGDHRIAMACAVAALAADTETTILNADAASVSFPEFFDTLRGITA
ncbi:MAG: 3-phosphoshikimate 1-carboxyvinyltransferase [Acidobacteria bacterium]|nr:3-phosphoshikimate 1-carboxyvinyltransferase [Acidobacteriota bacterium]MBI3278429.1 3-phosphoshikimate 1-carboxyvinyltransferase [Acidobacteriota bacterium]